MFATKTSRACFVVVALLIGACLAAASCGSGTNGAPPPQSEASPDQTAADTAGTPSTELANPASVNCEGNGGKLEIRTEPAGQFGVCIFPDGSRCEEWRFFRGECKPGECQAEDGKCEAKNN